MTVFGIAKFVLEHRRDGAFKDWTQLQVVQHVLVSSQNDGMATMLDGDKLVGVIFGKYDKDTNNLHISNVLAHSDAPSRVVIQVLMKKFYQMFNNETTITGTRDGKLKLYSAKLVARLGKVT